MKRKKSEAVAFAAGIIATVASMSMNGCQPVNTVNDPVFVGAADQFVNTTVGPEYEVYVMEDPKFGQVGELTPARQDRIDNITTFRDAVRQAQTELDETGN